MKLEASAIDEHDASGVMKAGHAMRISSDAPDYGALLVAA